MKLVRVEEAAKLLGVSAGALRRMSVKGEVPGAKIGGLWMYDLDKLMKFFEDKIDHNIKD